MIQLHNIQHIYNDQLVLESINLSIKQNAMMAIVGGNGAGKTTLLNIISGQLSPTKGQIQKKPNISIAYLPQLTHLDRDFPLCVYDVVAMGLWESFGSFGALTANHQHKINYAIHMAGLQKLERRSLHNLSGGQFQRVLFARLIAQDADVVLLDEPFTGIDQPTIRDLITLIQTWYAAGKTILAVLHDLDLVRIHFPSTILLSKSIIASGETSEVLNPKNLAKATFDGAI